MARFTYDISGAPGGEQVLLTKKYQPILRYIDSLNSDRIVFHIPIKKIELVPDWYQLNSDFKEAVIITYPTGLYVEVTCLFLSSPSEKRIKQFN